MIHAIAVVQQRRAGVKAAQTELERTKIRSPIEGVTGVRIVDPGNLVHAADQNGQVIITQLDPPRLLEFTWGDDPLRFELRPEGDGCVLVFTQTFEGRAAIRRPQSN